jgi:glycosyltransferase involved in cell wall biosynthesis
MKKILYIITQSEFGGAQRYVFDLATHLKNGYQVVVAAGEDPKGELFINLWQADLHHYHIKTVYLKYLKRRVRPISDLKALGELRELIAKEKPDIIHLNSSKAGVLGSIAAKFQAASFKFQVIYTAHGWVFNEPIGLLEKKIYLWIEKRVSKYRDKIICVSEYDRQIALERGFPPEKLATIHNGIDFDNLNFLVKEVARQKLSQLTNHPINQSTVIGTIANLYPSKGIQYLIKAARAINYLLPDAMPLFIVIGDGPEKAKLQRLIEKYKLENNFFLAGHLPYAYRYLKAFDIFTLSSVKEGFPYVVMEAMAAGLPVVGTSAGGVSEMLIRTDPFLKKPSEETPFHMGGLYAGLIAQPKNSQQLAEKIIYLLGNPEAAQELGKQAQIKVREKFTLEKMVEETKNLYAS